MPPRLDARPVVVAIAGPNGAGKSTFYNSFLRDSGLRFVNADEIARELDLDPYKAAAVADALRRELLKQRESFVFETVFSDPAGEKVEFLRQAAAAGYGVALCFVGIPSANVSDQRVAMRVTQGGHDVPTDKLKERFPRTLANLKRAISKLPLVMVLDNGDLADPYRKLAVFEDGEPVFLANALPSWFRTLPGKRD
ncbi:MAG: zeta toxin family protein [Planctomycetia bacterium]|nr:zeta toxin family protein [Planctomycetia bacterium]